MYLVWRLERLVNRRYKKIYNQRFQLKISPFRAESGANYSQNLIGDPENGSNEVCFTSFLIALAQNLGAIRGHRRWINAAPIN